MNYATQHVEEAIEAVADLEREAHHAMSPHQHWIETVTNRIGRPRTFYFVVSFVVLWMGANVMFLAVKGATLDPPPFYWLQGMVSMSGLLMTILILTTANRAAQIDTARDQLALQVNLLNERRTAKLIRMLDEIRRDSPQLPNRHDLEAQQLAEPTNTQEVAKAIEERVPGRPE